MATPTPTSSVFLRFLLSGFLLFVLLILCSLKNCHALDRRETVESHHLAVQISSLFPASGCNPQTIKGPNKRASLKVVHRHGPCSQLNQDEANSPTVAQILSLDQERVNSIHSRLAFNSSQDGFNDSQATLTAKSGASIGSGNYIVTIKLGTPATALSLFFDTGSDFSWTQCAPCARSCYKQQEPLFNPSKSTSYSNITCNSPTCSRLSSATGNSPRCDGTTCVYGIQYGDRSFSIGYFGQDKLTLTPIDVFDGFLFGCGQNNQGLFRGAAGLLGLGRDPLSLVSQTSKKYGKYFSYCLPSTPSSNGYLTFGKNGDSGTVKFTPMSTNSQNPSFYFITVTSISVGGRQVSINPTVFTTAGTIIDSGTVITRLPPAAYSAMRTAFRQSMSQYPMTQGVSLLDTCYDFSNFTTVSVPKIAFNFAGGLEVDLNLSGIFLLVNASQFCLAFAGNSDSSEVGIFGNVQQQTFNVIYDVDGEKLGFSPGGCS